MLKCQQELILLEAGKWKIKNAVGVVKTFSNAQSPQTNAFVFCLEALFLVDDVPIIYAFKTSLGPI